MPSLPTLKTKPRSTWFTVGPSSTALCLHLCLPHSSRHVCLMRMCCHGPLNSCCKYHGFTTLSSCSITKSASNIKQCGVMKCNAGMMHNCEGHRCFKSFVIKEGDLSHTKVASPESTLSLRVTQGHQGQQRIIHIPANTYTLPHMLSLPHQHTHIHALTNTHTHTHTQQT